MRKLLCRLFGHKLMAIGTQERVCQRCGQREMLQRFGSVLAWEELDASANGGSNA
jgi:hypothetical protein